MDHAYNVQMTKQKLTYWEGRVARGHRRVNEALMALKAEEAKLRIAKLSWTLALNANVEAKRRLEEARKASVVPLKAA